MTGHAVTLMLMNLLAGETRVVSGISGRCADATRCSGQTRRPGSVTPFSRRLGHPRDAASHHRFDEAFGHPLALRTSDRPRFRVHERFLANLAGTVVAEPLDFGVGLQRTAKAVLDGLKYDVTHHVTGMASRRRSPAHGLWVAPVECKDDAQRRAVITTESETVRAPACALFPVHSDLAVVAAR